MNVGLPATGLGGLFYLLTALLMPVVEFVNTIRSGRVNATRWRVAGFQAALAAGILAGLWGTAWVINLVIPESMRRDLLTLGRHMTDMLGVLPALLTLSMLGGLLVVIEGWSWITRPRQSSPHARLTPPTPHHARNSARNICQAGASVLQSPRRPRSLLSL